MFFTVDLVSGHDRKIAIEYDCGFIGQDVVELNPDDYLDDVRRDLERKVGILRAADLKRMGNPEFSLRFTDPELVKKDATEFPSLNLYSKICICPFTLDMDVYHDGKLLDNRMDFVSQGVSDGDELIGIKQELTDTFKFYVATMSGAKYFFYVNASYSVLKRFIFNGECLNDQSTLKECGVKPKDELDMMINLRGGMFHITSGRSRYDSLKPLKISELDFSGMRLEQFIVG